MQWPRSPGFWHLTASTTFSPGWNRHAWSQWWSRSRKLPRPTSSRMFFLPFASEQAQGSGVAAGVLQHEVRDHQGLLGVRQGEGDLVELLHVALDRGVCGDPEVGRSPAPAAVPGLSGLPAGAAPGSAGLRPTACIGRLGFLLRLACRAAGLLGGLDDLVVLFDGCFAGGGLHCGLQHGEPQGDEHQRERSGRLPPPDRRGARVYRPIWTARVRHAFHAATRGRRAAAAGWHSSADPTRQDRARSPGSPRAPALPAAAGFRGAAAGHVVVQVAVELLEPAVHIGRERHEKQFDVHAGEFE